MEPIRKRLTQEIDVKATLQAYAEELIKLSDTEKAVRNSRRFKRIIRAIFARFDKGQRITTPALLVMACQALKATTDNYEDLYRQLEQHLRLNRGRYLRIVSGSGGGVELIRP